MKTTDIRNQILQAIERRDWTRNRFAQACEDAGVYARSSTLAYLRGDRDVGSETAGRMLDLLELRVVPAPRRKGA